MLIDYFVTLGLDVVKDWIRDAREYKALEDNLRAYMHREWDNNEVCLTDEELDLQGLEEYIQGKFLEDARYYLMTKTPKERKEKECRIIEYAVACSKAEGEKAEKRAKAIILNVLTIFRGFYIESTDPKIRLLINDLSCTLGQKIEKIGDQLESVKAPVERINTKLDVLLSYERFALDEYISLQRDFIKKQTIFPWFNDSPKYQEVFPELFVPPRLEEHGKKYLLDDLLQEDNCNLIILGEYGVGKSTLLRYAFAFSNRDDCVYITARDAEAENDKGLLARIIAEAQVSSRKMLVFIDGIDEAFHKDPRRLSILVAKIKTAIHCHFWLGCRTDFFKRAFNENIAFADRSIEVLPWLPEQTERFVSTYCAIRNKPHLIERVNQLLESSKEPENIKTNPFQLALLVFLAENTETNKIRGTYDLYERFIQHWVDREIQRGTCEDDHRKTINVLREAAGKIYENEPFLIDEKTGRNTAVKDLLIMDGSNIYNEPYAVAFYHRSLAAFLLAQKTIESMLGGDIRQIEAMFSYKLKDDVTNFVGDCFSILRDSEKLTIKNNLKALYEDIAKDEGKLSVKEQILYFITRLGVDVSDFLLNIIRTNPSDPIMRLTLAYGCVLSDVPEVREFALEYARSLASEGTDTITNRAWTVIYFGDVEGDPYKYQDDEKAPWKNARAARIKRFTKKVPRLKDYRFRLFDVPLFHSFLKDRGWKDVTAEEYEILKAIDIPERYFEPEEIEFLTRQKECLLNEYIQHI